MKYILNLKQRILLALFVCVSTTFLVYFFSANSFFGTEKYQRETTSSHTFITDKQAKLMASSSLSILFVGDMMFDRYIRKISNKHGNEFLFSCIDPLLFKHNFVVGNLEGPITAKPSISIDSVIGSPENYSFTFPTSTAKLLFKHNIKVVSIGNNHINNQGTFGLTQTKEFLTDASVAFFGGLAEDEKIYRTTEQGVPISFIAYNQFGGGKEESVKKSISEEKASGRLVIVYAHWGEEYKDVTESVRATAKNFVESGADLIVGSHPHIVQSNEMIGETPVYYSLGNFIFDQYFDKEVMKGLALSVTISKDHSLTSKEYSLLLGTDGRTCFSD